VRGDDVTGTEVVATTQVMTTNVLVLGGTGFIGTLLTRKLSDCGHAVTVLSRSPESAALPDTVETSEGDVMEYDSIVDAFEGIDVAVNLVALSPLFEPSGDTTHEGIHLDGTRHVVQAAEEHGVQVVQMSALGADSDGQTAYIRAKGQAEEVVCESSIEWSIVRPSVVFGDGGEFVSFTKTLTTPYVTGLPGGGATRFQPIWVGDLVPMLAEVIENADNEHTGETYELGGPEVLTLADVATQVYHAEGKRLTVLPIPMLFARFGLTIAGAIPGIPMGPDQYRSLTFDNTVSDNDVTVFDRSLDDLRTLANYLESRTTGMASNPVQTGSDSSL
jgi:uncharacterized protein YbjT (DUF2867 family)